MTEECPYPGLAAFGEKDARWFFGRDGVLAELEGLLAEEPRRGPVMLVAASGAGKSSLLLAGLVPALERGVLPQAGSRRWPRLLFKPTASPLTALASQLSLVSGTSPESTRSVLAADPARAAALVGAAVSAGGVPGGGVAVVVDQFEEAFALCEDEAERTAFIEALCALAADPGFPSVVVLSLRADFYLDACAYPALRAALRDRQMLLGPMSDAELRQAIEYPGQGAGLELEAGLVELLVADLGGTGGRGPGGPGASYDAGRLPLLAHALRTTWQQRHGHLLTVDAYRATGRIGGAIAASAERTFGRLGDVEQELARQVFLRLVKIGDRADDTRRQVARADLVRGSGSPAAAEAVIEAFTAARLLTRERESVEITHEALLREWPRLREWTEQDRSGHLARQRLEDAAADWDREGRDASALLGGARLAAAHAWAADHARPLGLSPVARDFLTASSRRRRGTPRRNTVIAILAVLSAGLAVLAGTALTLNAAAQASLRKAESSVLDYQAGQALSVHDPGTAMELSVQADRLAPGSPQASTTLLGMQSQQFIGRLTPGTDDINGVAFSPDGATIATVGNDGTLRLWDTGTHDEVSVVTPVRGAAIDSVAFSPKGSLLASSQRGGVHLWDAADRARPRSLGLLALPSGLQAVRLAFSPDGRTLAAGAATGQVWLWDTARWEPDGTFTVPPKPVTSPGDGVQGLIEGLAFAGDGTTVIAGTAQGTIRFYDVRRKLVTSTLPNAGSPVEGQLAATADGTVLATTAKSSTSQVVNTVQLWDTARRKLITTLSGVPITDRISQVAISPDGSVTAAGDASGNVWLWAEGQLVGSLDGHTREVNGLAFSPDGKILASADTDGTVGLWSAGGNTIDGYANFGAAAAFTPDGTALAMQDNPGPVTFYAVPSRRKMFSLAISRSGQALVTALAFSPDGKTLAVALDDPARTVQLWDVPGRKPIGAIPTRHGSQFLVLAFSSDGRLLATSGQLDHTVKLWNTATLSLVGSLAITGAGPGPQPGATSLAFSPDGQEIAAASGLDSYIRLWNTRTRTPVPPLLEPLVHVAPVQVAFSPDGAVLAAGNDDGSASIWQMPSGSEVARLDSGGQQVAGVAFTDAGHALVTANADGTVRSWVAGSWSSPLTTLATAQSANQRIFGAAISPHGNMTVTEINQEDPVSQVGIILDRLWQTDPATLANGICQTLRAPLARSTWNAEGLTDFPYTPTCQESSR